MEKGTILGRTTALEAVGGVGRFRRGRLPGALLFARRSNRVPPDKEGPCPVGRSTRCTETAGAFVAKSGRGVRKCSAFCKF